MLPPHSFYDWQSINPDKLVIPKNLSTTAVRITWQAQLTWVGRQDFIY